MRTYTISAMGLFQSERSVRLFLRFDENDNERPVWVSRLEQAVRFTDIYRVKDLLATFAKEPDLADFIIQCFDETGFKTFYSYIDFMKLKTSEEVFDAFLKEIGEE